MGEAAAREGGGGEEEHEDEGEREQGEGGRSSDAEGDGHGWAFHKRGESGCRRAGNYCAGVGSFPQEQLCQFATSMQEPGVSPQYCTYSLLEEIICGSLDLAIGSAL